MSGWRAGGALLSSRANDDKVPTYLPGIQSTLVRVRLLAATFAAAIEASSVGDTQQQQESFRQDLEIHKILWPGLFQGGLLSNVSSQDAACYNKVDNLFVGVACCSSIGCQ